MSKELTFTEYFVSLDNKTTLMPLTQEQAYLLVKLGMSISTTRQEETL